jgi:hypothetical protein
MKHYSPTGRRNRGRPLKRILDTWDRNGSTSGPTPWQIYDDDDDDGDDDDDDDVTMYRRSWFYSEHGQTFFSEHLTLIFRDLKPLVQRIATMLQKTERARSRHTILAQNVGVVNLLMGQ